MKLGGIARVLGLLQLLENFKALLSHDVFCDLAGENSDEGFVVPSVWKLNDQMDMISDNGASIDFDEILFCRLL